MAVAVVQDSRVVYTAVAGVVAPGRPADSRTGFVVLSQSPVTSTFTAPLVDALIGGGSEPLDWLEYGTSGAAPTRLRIALATTLVVLAGAATLAAFGMRQTRRRGASRAE